MFLAGEDSTVDGIPVRWFGNPYSNKLGFWHRMLSFFRFMFAATVGVISS